MNIISREGVLKRCAALLVVMLMTFSMHGFAQQDEESPEEELARIRKTADEILQLISDTTGLPVTKEVKIDIVNKAQVREFMLESLEKDYPGDLLERQYAAFSYLGLVPEDLEIRSLLVDLITEQAGAFYNPENDTFYAISDLPPMFDNPLVEKTIIAHELTHALQDMKIDLFAMTRKLVDETDELYALMSTMEGMATVVMSVAVMPVDIRKLPDLGVQTRMQMEMMTKMPEMKVFSSAPLYLRESLLSPYAEGASFVYTFLKENPDATVGSLIDNMPVTSEQILHFYKYRNNDMPSKASMETLTAAYTSSGWDLLYSGVLGEFDLRVLMQLHGYEEKAVDIGAGWDACSFAALKRNGERLLIGSSAWDSEKDASEFADAIKNVLATVWGSGSVSVYTNGRAVSFIAADDSKVINEDVLHGLTSEVQFIE